MLTVSLIITFLYIQVRWMSFSAKKYGRLPYRSLRLSISIPTRTGFRDAPVVAYPQERALPESQSTRKFPVQNVKGSTYVVEYPLPYKSGEKLEP